MKCSKILILSVIRNDIIKRGFFKMSNFEKATLDVSAERILF